ncbi:hypothetical protein LDENG_00253880 [Lucifuga dentata]|nr:hypothetical protein LDENG_00253880 [Lucifuga dentata]
MRKKPKTYNFHSEWEHKFLFTLVNDRPVCRLCNQAVALAKKGDLERHPVTNHQKFKDFPPQSALRSAKVTELKSALKTTAAVYQIHRKKKGCSRGLISCQAHWLDKADTCTK